MKSLKWWGWLKVLCLWWYCGCELFQINTIIVVAARKILSEEWSPTKCGPTNQMTSWGETVTPNNTLPEYPRPQMVRQQSIDGNGNRNGNGNENWLNLNGLWEFQGSNNSNNDFYNNINQNLTQIILVPFPAESCLSGIGQTYKYLQYRTNFYDFAGRNPDTTRLLLHFGAVDWQCNVYINGKWVGNHTGGYDSFTFDISEYVSQSDSNDLYVQVYDPSDEGVQPNGKQRISAITDPGGDTYTPSSGIWQTVWLEVVPSTYIDYFQIIPQQDLTTIKVNVSIKGDLTSDGFLIKVWKGQSTIISVKGQTGTWVSFTIMSPILWTQYNPFLYNATITLNSGDEIQTYFGIRSYTLGTYVRPDTGPQQYYDRPGSDMDGYPITLNSSDYRLCWALCNQTQGCLAWAYGVPGCDQYTTPQCWLKNGRPNLVTNHCRVTGARGGPPVKRPLFNNQPIFLAGWLDQSFWPDGLYTAPTDDALKFDLLAISQYGLNMVRLHQKVNPERWYYYADQLGILVWQDAVQKYGGASSETIPYFMNDLQRMVNGKINHPSIIQWETFNENDCWQVFPNISYVVNDVQTWDPSRLVDADSGGSANNFGYGNVNDIHTYPDPQDNQATGTQYPALGEYGGLGYFVPNKEWVANGCYAYKKVSSSNDFVNTYYNMSLNILTFKSDGLAAVVYTQITDIEEECDGYLNYDRTSKFDATEQSNLFITNQAMIALN